MSRVWLIPIVAVVASIVPSLVHAQPYVIPSCTDPAVISRSSYDRPIPCVKTAPIPPPVVAYDWFAQQGTPPPSYVAPVYVPPVYVPPMYAAPPVYIAPSRGLDPWIPLAGQPPSVASPNDLLGQLLLLEQLAAARSRRPPTAPAPAYIAPAPTPAPAVSGDGWMSAYIKGVK